MCTELILATIYFTTISFINYLLAKLLLGYIKDIKLLKELSI
jgi:hypothetical protein